MERFFEQVLLRLKEQLQLRSDKEVAGMLDLSPTAFNDRKKRGSFPEDKLLALTVKRPDLELDVVYILTGERATSVEREQFARMIQSSIDVDGSQGANLIQGAAGAIKRHGDHIKKRKPLYEKLNATLDFCNDEDVALVQAMATRLRRGKT